MLELASESTRTLPDISRRDWLALKTMVRMDTQICWLRKKAKL